MNHLHNLRTTSHLLRQSSLSLSSNLPTFLLLSLLLFSFRTALDSASSRLTSFIDRDPSLRHLLRHLDLAANSDHRHHLRPKSPDHPPYAPRRRRPFLHLSRVGTLDDDFFSGDDHDGRALFGPHPYLPPNATYLALNRTTDNAIRVSQAVRPGVTFKSEALLFTDGENKENEAEEADLGNNSENENEEIDFRFFMKGLEVGHPDGSNLMLFISSLFVAYGGVILSFIFVYSIVFGVVFITVVKNLLGRYSSMPALIWNGSRLGLKRLTGFFLMRWAVRDALTQLLGLWYFGDIEDQYSFFKLFVRLKLMPFSVMAPWVRGFEREIAGFLLTWFFVDTFVGFIFSVDAWIVIVDSRRSGREILKEGCYFISTMLNQAIKITLLEAICCGSILRLLLSPICGRFLAKMLQSTMEVYFLITWLLFYFATRCRDADLQGRVFGQRELEGLIEGHR